LFHGKLRIEELPLGLSLLRTCAFPPLPSLLALMDFLPSPTSIALSNRTRIFLMKQGHQENFPTLELSSPEFFFPLPFSRPQIRELCSLKRASENLLLKKSRPLGISIVRRQCAKFPGGPLNGRRRPRHLQEPIPPCGSCQNSLSQTSAHCLSKFALCLIDF